MLSPTRGAAEGETAPAGPAPGLASGPAPGLAPGPVAGLAPGRAPGRPRDQRVDRDVLEATRQLLIEVGYAALTIDAIARRANVSRPTIYRRWRSKPQLVHAAVYPSDGDETFHMPETGDFAADLRAIVTST